MSAYQPFLETTKYTRVHNYLIDSVMPVVSPTAFKVLILIWRHTLGFVDSAGERVKSAQMAYSVIKTKTGIKHNVTLSESIKELLYLGLIQVVEGKEYEANSYSIIMTHVAKSESDLRKCKSKYDADRKLKAKSENDVPPTSENDDNKRKNTFKEKNIFVEETDSPKLSPAPRKQKEVWNAIRDHMGITANGRLSVLEQQMLGRFPKTDTHYLSNFDPPATPQEVEGFVKWWRNKYPDGKLPLSPPKLQDHFYKFRDSTKQASSRPGYIHIPGFGWQQVFGE